MLLCGAVLYGANAAGKSNLFNAISYLKDVASESRKRGSGTGRKAFKFSECHDEPSHLDMQFIVGETLYRFGVLLDDDQIIKEWLTSIHGGEEEPIYERETNKEGDTTVTIASDKEEIGDKLEALSKVGGPKEQSFLATIQLNLDSDDYEPISNVIDWFQSKMFCIPADSYFGHLEEVLDLDNNLLSFTRDFLNASDTGVDDLDIISKEMSEESLSSLFSEDKDVVDTVKSQTQKGYARIQGFSNDGNRVMLVLKKMNEKMWSLFLKTVHRHETSNDILFDVKEESDGTKRLLHLLPALYRLSNDKNCVFIIDEIERSMHPLLVREILEFFFNKCKGNMGQLIITTHEVSLLDSDLFRRDEVWLCEKNKRGATSLYSIADFEPKYSAKLKKHYLQGRFGAIPFLSGIGSINTNGR